MNMPVIFIEEGEFDFEQRKCILSYSKQELAILFKVPAHQLVYEIFTLTFLSLKASSEKDRCNARLNS
jgi:hypothetical protein